MIGAVLVHDREPLDPALGRTGFGNIDDPRIEIAALPGDALVDLVGDAMRHHAPVVRRGAVARTDHLLLREDVPQPELDRKPAVGRDDRPAIDQGLGVDQPPVAETRLDPDIGGRLDERLLVDRTKQAGTREIGGDDLGDPPAVIRALRIGALEVRYRDRQGLDLAAGDVHLQLGAGRHPQRRGKGKRQQSDDERTRQIAQARVLHRSNSLVSKLNDIACQTL